MSIVKARNINGIDALDASVNIGTSGSPTTISITVPVGARDPGLGQAGSSALWAFSFGDLSLTGFSVYSVTKNRTPQGITKTYELIDSSFNILDGNFHVFGCGSSGAPKPSRSNYYYTYTKNEWEFAPVSEGSKRMEWRVRQGSSPQTASLAIDSYQRVWDEASSIYKAYLRAVENVEAIRADRERALSEQESQSNPDEGQFATSESPSCEDQEEDPVSDVILLGDSDIPAAGQLSRYKDTILSFPSWPNPYTERGEILFTFDQIFKEQIARPAAVPRGALFSYQGSWRSVLGSICSHAGISFFWNPVSNRVQYVLPKENIQMPSIPPSAISSSIGETMANSSKVVGTLNKYVPGGEMSPDSNDWTWRKVSKGKDMFDKIVQTISDLNTADPPKEGDLVTWAIPSDLDRAMAFLHLGEEAYKTLWISQNSEDFTPDNAKKAKMLEIGVYGDDKLACMVHNLSEEQTEGCDEVSKDKYKLISYSPSDLEAHLVEMRSYMAYCQLFKSCGSNGSIVKYKTSNWSHPKNPYLLEKSLEDTGYVSTNDVGYFELQHDATSDCRSVGGVTIHKPSDKVLSTPFGNAMSSFTEDNPCIDSDISGMTVEEFVGNAFGGAVDWLLCANNNTWSFNYDSCFVKQIQDWAKGGLITFSQDIGPAEFGESPDLEFYKDYTDGQPKESLAAIVREDPPFTGFPFAVDSIKGLPMDITSFAEISPGPSSGGTGWVDSWNCNNVGGNSPAANFNVVSASQGAVSESDAARDFSRSSYYVGATDHASYTLHGNVEGDFVAGHNWNSVITALESLNISLGSDGFSATYNFGGKKRISPSAFLLENWVGTGNISNSSHHNSSQNLSTRFKNNFLGSKPSSSSSYGR